MYINIEEVPGLYFEFEYQDVDDISFAPKLYLDNVVKETKEIGYTIFKIINNILNHCTYLSTIAHRISHAI